MFFKLINLALVKLCWDRQSII